MRRAAGGRTRSPRLPDAQIEKVPWKPTGASPMPMASRTPSTLVRSSATAGTARQNVGSLRDGEPGPGDAGDRAVDPARWWCPERLAATPSAPGGQRAEPDAQSLLGDPAPGGDRPADRSKSSAAAVDCQDATMAQCRKSLLLKVNVVPSPVPSSRPKVSPGARRRARPSRAIRPSAAGIRRPGTPKTWTVTSSGSREGQGLLARGVRRPRPAGRRSAGAARRRWWERRRADVPRPPTPRRSGRGRRRSGSAPV